MTERIRTSHELGRLLEAWAKVLLGLPEVDVRELAGGSKGKQAGGRGSSSDPRLTVELEELARRLPEFEKEKAHSELSVLTVKQIRTIGTFLQIRTPSKMPKAEVIDMLLRHLFDIPAGQEVVRTFAKLDR